MDGFEDMGMHSYLSSPMGVATANQEEYNGALTSMSMSNQMVPVFDTSDFGIPEDTAYMPSTLPQGSSQTYPFNYQDAFPDSAALLDSAPPDRASFDVGGIDRDSKVLEFQQPTYSFTLLDMSLQRTSISIGAELNGMFFMAELHEQGRYDHSAPPAELTCYRRNLFQVVGSITLPRALRYIMTDNGDRIPIVGQELTVSATESVEGNMVKLISVPWKTPISHTASTPEDRVEREPSSVPLDIMSNQDMNSDFATFPIAWKRLQFRTATANNGRRKELQQHFVVRLKLVATLSTGARIAICESRSGPVVVRGRSPRNFQQRKDLPVGIASANNHRRGVSSVSLIREPTTESHHLKAESSPDGCHPQLERHSSQTSSTFDEWRRQSSDTAPASRTATTKPPPIFHSERSTSTSSISPPPPKALPFSPPDQETTTQRSSKAARTNLASSATNVTMTNPAFLASQVNPADLLYEYFPLGLDDWQPPVDAVYRPHVVHHLAAPQSTPGERSGRPSLGGRSKRYFSEDQSTV